MLRVPLPLRGRPHGPSVACAIESSIFSSNFNFEGRASRGAVVEKSESAAALALVDEDFFASSTRKVEVQVRAARTENVWYAHFPDSCRALDRFPRK